MEGTKVWFITGCSSGFGRAMTELVLQKGHRVVATLRRPEVLIDLSSKYPAQFLLILKLDVTNQSEVVDAFARAQEHYGRIDVVFNNAGYAAGGEVEGFPEDVARHVLEVNFWGAVYVSKEAIRFFREVNDPQGGFLIQNSSLGGIGSETLFGFYSASKFALEGLTEALSKELDPSWDIRITLVEPGWFGTDVVINSTLVPQHEAYKTSPASVMARKIQRLIESGAATFKDTSKGVEAIYRLSELPDPPFRLPLGKDSLKQVRKKGRHLLKTADENEHWSSDLGKNHLNVNVRGRL